MRKLTKQKLNEIEKKTDDVASSLSWFKRETNQDLNNLREKFNKLTLGPETSATKRELLSDRHVNEAKFNALEQAYNEILEVLELKNIKIKTNCPECKQELPEDYNES
jgi:hypothetical protein